MLELENPPGHERLLQDDLDNLVNDKLSQPHSKPATFKRGYFTTRNCEENRLEELLEDPSEYDFRNRHERIDVLAKAKKLLDKKPIFVGAKKEKPLLKKS